MTLTLSASLQKRVLTADIRSLPLTLRRRLIDDTLSWKQHKALRVPTKACGMMLESTLIFMDLVAGIWKPFESLRLCLDGCWGGPLRRTGMTRRWTIENGTMMTFAVLKCPSIEQEDQAPRFTVLLYLLIFVRGSQSIDSVWKKKRKLS
jgi:hypothetical protein